MSTTIDPTLPVEHEPSKWLQKILPHVNFSHQHDRPRAPFAVPEVVASRSLR